MCCSVVGISEACYHYQPKLNDENDEIADWLIRLTQTHKRWGFGLCFDYLRTQGFNWNHKRVYRIYCELKLNQRIKPRKRLKRDKPEQLAVPETLNQTWSMDFMSDNLSDGRTLRTFNVIDDYNRECLTIDVGLSLPSERVIRGLERVIEWRGKPQTIRCDNGPEYISQKLKDWASEKIINIAYIQPGKPTQNAYIERFNRTVREECLDLHWFESISEAENVVTEWMWLYNNERPHSAVGKIPPRKVKALELTST